MIAAVGEIKNGPIDGIEGFMVGRKNIHIIIKRYCILMYIASLCVITWQKMRLSGNSLTCREMSDLAACEE